MALPASNSTVPVLALRKALLMHFAQLTGSLAGGIPGSVLGNSSVQEGSAGGGFREGWPKHKALTLVVTSQPVMGTWPLGTKALDPHGHLFHLYPWGQHGHHSMSEADDV